MGYFNYFIKCIIRKFVNILFSTKGMIIIFIIIFFLYLFCGVSRAEWTDTQIEQSTELFESIAEMTYRTYQQLLDVTSQLDNLIVNTGWISNDVVTIRNTLGDINVQLDSLLTNDANFLTKLDGIVSQLEIVSTEITNIYNKLDENQQELLTELEEDNQAILEELNMIRDSINGSEEELTTFIDNGVISSDSTINTYEKLRSISLNYENRYSYTIKLYYNNPYNYDMNVRYHVSDNIINSGYSMFSYRDKFTQIDLIPVGYSEYSVTFNVPSTNPKYIYFTYGNNITKIEVYRSIKGIVESLNQSNDLQQQQNQLQQEQNNFLQQGASDSDVSVDGFNNVDSNDITSSGLNGVFNSIYSSISSWTSKDMNLPIPYTNKSIVIPANYTENMLNSSGAGWIITFVHAVYYFIVGRFMIYSITNIVNSIKSGSILNTDSKNNITTDML